MNCWWWTQRAPLKRGNKILDISQFYCCQQKFLIYKGNFIFFLFPDSFYNSAEKAVLRYYPIYSIWIYSQLLKVLQVVIDFRTRPPLGVISLVVPAPFSLPTPVTALLVQGSITEDCFPRQLISRMQPGSKYPGCHWTPPLVWHSSACFNIQLISRQWPWSQQVKDAASVTTCWLPRCRQQI